MERLTVEVKEISETKEREFLRWIDLAKVGWGLKVNYDKNPIHRIWQWALRFMEFIYPEAITQFDLDRRELVVSQGLSQLTQVEEIALEEYGLLPLSFKVKFPVPLIVLKNEPQLIKIKFKSLGENRFSVEVRYGFVEFDNFFGTPTMESFSGHPFVFCTAENRGSGIDDKVRKKFKKILDGNGIELKIGQNQRERDAYCESVDCKTTSFRELFKKIYGNEHGSPTLAAARIPSDIVPAIDKDIYKDSDKIVLYREQRLHFNQTVRYRLGDNLRTRILVTEQRRKVTSIDTAFITDDEILCLGRSHVAIKQK
ncbi:hypothetical protein KJA17_00255 [Patescibacteria group bacterium]|nr:hypothetical protein [Patescibacteria group bacterium]